MTFQVLYEPCLKVDSSALYHAVQKKWKENEGA